LLPLAQYAYNSAELKGTGVTLFFTNYKYTLIAYKAPLIDNAHTQGAIMRVEEFKNLH
jgi:hypothetical protein